MMRSRPRSALVLDPSGMSRGTKRLGRGAATTRYRRPMVARLARPVSRAGTLGVARVTRRVRVGVVTARVGINRSL